MASSAESNSISAEEAQHQKFMNNLAHRSVRFYMHAAPGYGDQIQVVGLVRLLQQYFPEKIFEIIFHDAVAEKMATLFGLDGLPIVKTPHTTADGLKVISLSFFQANEASFATNDIALGSVKHMRFNPAEFLKSHIYVGIPSDVGAVSDFSMGYCTYYAAGDSSSHDLVDSSTGSIPFPLPDMSALLRLNMQKIKNINFSFLVNKMAQGKLFSGQIYGLNPILMTKAGSTEQVLIKLMLAANELHSSGEVVKPIVLGLFNEISDKFEALKNFIVSGDIPEQLRSFADDEALIKIRAQLKDIKFLSINDAPDVFVKTMGGLEKQSVMVVDIGNMNPSLYQLFTKMSDFMVSEGDSSERLSKLVGIPNVPCASRGAPPLIKVSCPDIKLVDAVANDLCPRPRFRFGSKSKSPGGSVFTIASAVANYIAAALDPSTKLGKCIEGRNVKPGETNPVVKCINKAVEAIKSGEVQAKFPGDLLKDSFEGRFDTFEGLDGLSTWPTSEELASWNATGVSIPDNLYKLTPEALKALIANTPSKEFCNVLPDSKMLNKLVARGKLFSSSGICTVLNKCDVVDVEACSDAASSTFKIEGTAASNEGDFYITTYNGNHPCAFADGSTNIQATAGLVQPDNALLPICDSSVDKNALPVKSAPMLVAQSFLAGAAYGVSNEIGKQVGLPNNVRYFMNKATVGGVLLCLDDSVALWFFNQLLVAGLQYLGFSNKKAESVALTLTLAMATCASVMGSASLVKMGILFLGSMLASNVGASVGSLVVKKSVSVSKYCLPCLSVKESAKAKLGDMKADKMV